MLAPFRDRAGDGRRSMRGFRARSNHRRKQACELREGAFGPTRQSPPTGTWAGQSFTARTQAGWALKPKQYLRERIGLGHALSDRLQLLLRPAFFGRFLRHPTCSEKVDCCGAAIRLVLHLSGEASKIAACRQAENLSVDCYGLLWLVITLLLRGDRISSNVQFDLLGALRARGPALQRGAEARGAQLYEGAIAPSEWPIRDALHADFGKSCVDCQ